MVEAAPQVRPKTTPVSNTALRPLLCSPSLLNALPVPLPIQVVPDRTRADLFPMVFRCVFSGRFWKGLFLVFLWFREVLRVPRGVILATFLDKIEIFGEKLGPSFLHTITAFWLDFQGPAPPGESKKREKTASEN